MVANAPVLNCTPERQAPTSGSCRTERPVVQAPPMRASTARAQLAFRALNRLRPGRLVADLSGPAQGIQRFVDGE